MPESTITGQYALYIARRDEGIIASIRDCLPIRSTLPCGQTLLIQTLADLPLEDLPCPCGDPHHYLVRWAV